MRLAKHEAPRRTLPWAAVVVAFAALAFAFTVQPANAVREGDFKKCKDSSFCRRIRRLSSYVEAPESTLGSADADSKFQSPYSIVGTPVFDDSLAQLKASVGSALHPQIKFGLQVLFYKDGTSRVMMDEEGQRYGGWKRYDEAAKWAVDQQPEPAEQGTVNVQSNEKETVVT